MYFRSVLSKNRWRSASEKQQQTDYIFLSAIYCFRSSLSALMPSYDSTKDYIGFLFVTTYLQSFAIALEALDFGKVFLISSMAHLTSFSEGTSDSAQFPFSKGFNSSLVTLFLVLDGRWSGLFPMAYFRELIGQIPFSSNYRFCVDFSLILVISLIFSACCSIIWKASVSILMQFSSLSESIRSISGPREL